MSKARVAEAIDLAGDWRYLAQKTEAGAGTEADDYAAVHYDHTGWPAMYIPQNWFLGKLDHHGVVWFRREFEYKPQTGQYATLRFDGVDYHADVYLNGVHLGHHEGYFELFSFDVTEHLRAGPNLLAVRVNSPFEEVGPDGWHMRKRLIKGVLNHHDCRPGGGWGPAGQSYNTGGIWNRVTVLTHGPLTIDWVLLRADLDGEQAMLHGTITVINRGPGRALRLQVACVPDSFSGNEYEDEVPLEIPPGLSTHEFALETSGVALWQPWDRGEPNLYRVTACLLAEEEGQVLGEVETGFGFRTITVDQNYHWTVNGQPYFPRGSNYIASQWLSETLFPEVARAEHHPFPPPGPKAPSSAWFERDVALMKQANLNTIRVHAHVLPPEFHGACDRAGVLVWQDFPLQWGYVDHPDFHAEAERQVRAMVRLLYNHPSIVAWCCHNESPWDAEWMASERGGSYDANHNRALDARLEEAVKALDPTRYVHRNSGTGDGHAYPGWYYGHWRDYDGLPAAPFPTEYGAQGLPVRESLLHMFAHFGPDAGHGRLVHLKAWADEHLPQYDRLPSPETVPQELACALEILDAWRFHGFQPAETLIENRVSLGDTLDEFIASSQAYQSWIVQYGTEMYRRHKYDRVNGVIQFMFVEAWPSITWAVLDYWRTPKPAYDALRRAMQPVLPSADLTREVAAGEPLRFHLCVVNDLLQAFPGALCHWILVDANGESISSGEWVLDLPQDCVSERTLILGPILAEGEYRLEIHVQSAGGRPLGANLYPFKAV